ncbi:MAG TPA: hypothetical protein VFV19_08645 [Candidatus Polarisedimenticolaceae bacterium]|nr:hypothetical protein [Candidatus Polarisedimenticolaceae bacterium]
MTIAAPPLAAIVMLTLTIVPARAAFKDQRIVNPPTQDHVDKIRIADEGPFQVWNGNDGDAPIQGTRLLAVIGARKSLRVSYSASMPPPQVQMGEGWAEVVAGAGTAMTFSTPESDCVLDTILWCTSGPFTNLPPGTIVCMCTRTDGSICCTSDTGIYPKRMIPIEGDL